MTEHQTTPPDQVDFQGRTLELSGQPEHGLTIKGETWDTYLDPDDDEAIFERSRESGRIIRTV